MGTTARLASYLLSIRKFPLISRRQIPYEPTVFKTEKPAMCMNITVDSNFLIAIYNYSAKEFGLFLS